MHKDIDSLSMSCDFGFSEWKGLICFVLFCYFRILDHVATFGRQFALLWLVLRRRPIAVNPKAVFMLKCRTSTWRMCRDWTVIALLVCANTQRDKLHDNIMPTITIQCIPYNILVVHTHTHKEKETRMLCWHACCIQTRII